MCFAPAKKSWDISGVCLLCGRPHARAVPFIRIVQSVVMPVLWLYPFSRRRGNGDFFLSILGCSHVYAAYFVGSIARSFCCEPGDIHLAALYGLAHRTCAEERQYFCFLIIVLGVFLWVVVLSALFDPVFARADNPICYVFYAAAAGATPFAAFPGIVLFGGKKTNRHRRWGIGFVPQPILVPMKPGFSGAVLSCFP